MDTSLSTGLFTLGGAALGFLASITANLINARHTYESSEKTRMLDLYKVVYPDKYNAVKDLMSKVSILSENIIYVSVIYDSPNIDFDDSIMTASINEVLQSVSKDAWLVGQNMAVAAKTMAIKAELLRRHDMSKGEAEELRESIERLYNSLNIYARNELGLVSLATVIPVIKVDRKVKKNPFLRKTKKQSVANHHSHGNLDS